MPAVAVGAALTVTGAALAVIATSGRDRAQGSAHRSAGGVGPAVALDRPASATARPPATVPVRPAQPRPGAAAPLVPDVLVLAHRSLSATALHRLRAVPGVTALSGVDVGTVRISGARAVVYGVDPATFRPLSPAPSARSDALWQSIGRGELAASFDMAHELKLPLGGTVVLDAARGSAPVRVGAFASMGLPDTDAVVDRARSAELGLAPSRGAVVSAPHADPVRLRAALRRIVGSSASVQLLQRVVTLRDPGSLASRATLRTVLRAASSRLGAPYRWGATGPDAFDCSGLVGWAYRQAGIALPRTAAQQWLAGPHVAYADARPGDLLFWAYDPTAPGFIDHVALYAGGGMMLVAPHTGDVVSLRPVPMGHFMGVVRIDPSGR
ncbi:MAG: C40 family peptidase [Frankiaceae bacterium]